MAHYSSREQQARRTPRHCKISANPNVFILTGGKFTWGAPERGGFGPGLIPVANQAEQADRYQRYLCSVLINSHFVGAHWFAYVDEPLTGRLYDGEIMRSAS
jgi:hypothetical protein